MILSLFSSLSAKVLEIGSPAPDVSVSDHEGNVINLASACSEGTTLVFFYPKAMTPGCTKQACSLRDSWDELQTRGVTIYGVSSDTAATQQEFRDKYQLPFILLADTKQVVSRAFKKTRWSRHAYIFQDGTLVWSDLSAATTNQAAEVLAALDKLEK